MYKAIPKISTIFFYVLVVGSHSLLSGFDQLQLAVAYPIMTKY